MASKKMLAMAPDENELWRALGAG